MIRIRITILLAVLILCFASAVFGQWSPWQGSGGCASGNCQGGSCGPSSSPPRGMQPSNCPGGNCQGGSCGPQRGGSIGIGVVGPRGGAAGVGIVRPSKQSGINQEIRTEAPQHDFMCDVKCSWKFAPNSQGIVSEDPTTLGYHTGGGIVITAAHLLSPGYTLTVTYKGQVYPAELVFADASNDVAMVKTSAPFTQVIHVFGDRLQPGTPVGWQYGMGTVDSYKGGLIVIRGKCRSGDSGSPIWVGGRGVVGQIRQFEDNRFVVGPCGEEIIKTINAWKQSLKKPDPIDDLPLPPDVVPPAPPAVNPCIATDKKVDALIARIDSLEKSVNGLGKGGSADVTAIQQTLVTVQQNFEKVSQNIESCVIIGGRLKEIERKLNGLQKSVGDLALTVSCDSARIGVLEKSCTGTTTPDTSGEVTHLVLVRDATADYWPRMNSELKVARGHFSDIEESDPPSFAVALPQLVAYSNGVPVRVWKGVRQVGDALRAITRDEFSAKSS